MKVMGYQKRRKQTNQGSTSHTLVLYERNDKKEGRGGQKGIKEVEWPQRVTYKGVKG